MNKKLVIWVSAALAACGGGVGSSALADTAMQARWDQNIAQVAQVRSAIAKCAESSNGILANRCDSLVLLTSDFLPRTYTLVPGQFESGAPTIVRGTAALVLVGNEGAGNCTVTLTPWTSMQGVSWGYTNEGGAHCDRAISTRLAWSENISQTTRTRTAIEECSKKSDGVLAGNCDTMALLTRKRFLPTGYAAVAAQFESAAPTITAATAALVLTGTAQAGNCVVTISPAVTEKGVTWAYTNGGAGCDRLKTGVGT